MRHYRDAVLAAYLGGVVRARKAAKIGLHLATCPRCSGATSQLVAMSRLLAEISAPPMPDQIATRISRALASESAARTSPSTVAEPSAAGPVIVPGRPDLPDRSRRGSRWFRMPELSSPVLLRAGAATAAIAVLAGAGFLLARGQSSSGNANTSAGTPASRNALHSAAGAPNHSQKFSGAQAPPATEQVSYHRGSHLLTATAVASQVNVTQKTLAGQVRKKVATYAPILGSNTSVPQPTAAPAATGDQALRAFGPFSLARLGACLTNIAAGREVLLAEFARFRGKRAVIIVIAPIASAQVFDVEIVGLACSGVNSDLITHASVPVR